MKPAASVLTKAQFTLTTVSVGAAVLPHLLRLPLIFSVPIAALLIGRWFQRQYTGVRVPIWIKLPLIILFPVLIIFHYGNIFGREPGSVLACAMLTLKLVETDNRRDARTAVCFSAFVLMSALLFNADLIFTLLLLAALSLILTALRALEPRPLDQRALSTPDALREGMRISALALLAAIPLASCVFLFFPRLGSPLWGSPNDPTAHTGLGDTMAPGTIQELLIDDSPAFRVAFHGATPPRQDLYWRGPVLSTFDGLTWLRPEFNERHGKPEFQTSGQRVTYDVTLEPTDRRWLLALDVPVSTPDNALLGPDMSLVNRSPVASLLQYEATSATRYVLDSTLTESARRQFLKLPEGFNPQSIAQAKTWRDKLKNDDAIIRAALNWFHDEFFYTLSAPLLERDSVDDFLFNTKSGFCEHYSSAFTFLMRAAGIPSRVVTGYQGGYYNSVGDYWVVRQSDAHAWSEVWLQGRGWVRIDPTAAVSPQRVELGSREAAGQSARWYQAGWLQAMRNQFDLVNRVWNEAIVQFSALRQQSMLTPFGIDKADYGSLMTMLIGTSTFLLMAFVWWILRAPRVRDDALDIAYEKLRAKLSKAGTASAPADGPLTLAEKANARWPDNENLALAFVDYIRLRYGCQLPDASDVRTFARSVSSLRFR